MSARTAARARYQRDYYDRYERAARGHEAMRDGAPAAARVAECLAVGMSMEQVAAAAGVASSTVNRLMRDPSTRLRARVSAAILAVRPARPLTPVGVTRRVRALACLGWSVTEIAAAAGVNVDTVKEVRRGERRELHTAGPALVAAYDALSMRTPSPLTRQDRSAVTQVRNRAARAGWAPPLAWDDDTIDDPAATPDLGAPPADARHDDVVDDAVLDRVLTGIPTATTSAERAALIPVLAARQLSDRDIAALCRTTDRTIHRTRLRLGVRSQWGAAA